MTERLPKSMVDALARGTTPAEHPSADLLSAFVERALGEDETQGVAEHLTRCAECREVVFLASVVIETPADEREKVLDSRAAAGVQTAIAVPKVAEVTRLRRNPAWLWAAAVAAVLVVAGGFVLYQREGDGKAPTELASAPAQPLERPAQAVVENRGEKSLQAVAVEPKIAPPATAAKTQAKASPQLVLDNRKEAGSGSRDLELARGVAAPPPSGTETQPGAMAPNVASATAGAAVGGPVQMAPAVPRANGFVSPKGEGEQSFGAASSAQFTPQSATISVLQALHPGWRITAQGHLEHRTQEGWTRALTEQTGPCRVVATLGTNVWAGGDGGMLYRSTDGGQSWRKVALNAAGSPEKGAIVTIRFEDGERGTVTTDGGSTYATSDGGANWTKQ